MSRWTSPAVCAASSAVATCVTMSTARLGGQGAALGEQVRQVGPFHQPHVDVELPVDLAEVVDGDDVWLVQLRGERGLGAEAGLERGVGSQGRRAAV